MKNIEVSEEELKVLNDLREEKFKQEEALRLEEEERNNLSKLESEFEAALEKANEEIKVCIGDAQKAMEKAEGISEKYGVPFHSPIHNFSSRLYTPKSLDEKWPGVDSEFLDCFNLYRYSNYGKEPGWEYWSASSLRC